MHTHTHTHPESRGTPTTQPPLVTRTQATAERTVTGFKTPLSANWTHNNGAGIEMLHRGTSSCNMSSAIQWAEHRIAVAGALSLSVALPLQRESVFSVFSD
jgi:hypothetical protein